MAFLVYAIGFIFLPNTFSCANTNIDFSGEWAFEIESPQGPYAGAIILEKAFEGYSGHIQSGTSKIEMTDIAVSQNEMSFKIAFDGYPITISGVFDGDTYTGVISVEGMKIPLLAKKKP